MPLFASTTHVGLIQVLALASNIMSIRIRKEAPTDVAAIEAVTVAAFQNAAHTSHTEQFIVATLRKAGQLSVSLVVNRLVGRQSRLTPELSRHAQCRQKVARFSVPPFAGTKHVRLE